MNQTFKQWTQEENETWKQLSARQIPNLQNKVSSLWLKGFEELKMSQDQVPDFDVMSERLLNLSGWQLTPTSVVFADGQMWFQLLKQKKLLISDYIRPGDSLDYTPLPDVFHDAFGHLPFFTNPQFCRIVQLFTDRILSADKKERAALGHLWWFSVEFGLIKEQGEIKALGAGLASSFTESNSVFSKKTTIMPFDPDLIAATDESHHQLHATLFVLDSLDQLEDIVVNWTLHV